MNRRELIVGALAAPIVAAIPAVGMASAIPVAERMSIIKATRTVEYHISFDDSGLGIFVDEVYNGLASSEVFKWDWSYVGYNKRIVSAEVMVFEVHRSWNEKVDCIYPKIFDLKGATYHAVDTTNGHVFQVSGLDKTINYVA